MVFNEVIDNSIVIIPSNFKSFLRNYKFINYKLNFKVFSKENKKKELFGKKSDEIIGFLLKNSNYTFDFINTFLDYYFSNALIKKVFLNRKKEKKVRKQAYTDELTGKGNRYLLYLDLDRLIDQEKNIAVCFMDLDSFKQINDALGHEAGDEVLKEIANKFGLTREYIRDIRNHKRQKVISDKYNF